MTVYAMSMTLLVGMFIGSYITLAIALIIEKRQQDKMDEAWKAVVGQGSVPLVQDSHS